MTDDLPGGGWQLMFTVLDLQRYEAAVRLDDLWDAWREAGTPPQDEDEFQTLLSRLIFRNVLEVVGEKTAEVVELDDYRREKESFEECEAVLQLYQEDPDFYSE